MTVPSTVRGGTGLRLTDVGVETYVEEIVVGAATLLQAVPVVGEVCATFLAFTSLVGTARSNKGNLRKLQHLCDIVIEGVLRKRSGRWKLLDEGFADLREQVKKAEDVAKLCNGVRLKEKLKRTLLAVKICGDIASVTVHLVNLATVHNLVVSAQIKVHECLDGYLHRA